MNVWTVRKRIAIGFSAVIAVMVALCAFAYVQLRGIEAQAVALRTDSVPGLYLVGRLHAVSIATYSSVQQHILERNPARMQQIIAYLETKTTERLDLLKRYEPTIKTDKGRELYEATKSNLAIYMAVRRQVERLSADPKAKAEAAALLQDRLEPLYSKLQGAIQAEVDYNKSNADEAGARIEATVARAQTGMLISLLAGLLLALAAGYLLVQAIDRPLSRLLAALEPMRSGDFTGLSFPTSTGMGTPTSLPSRE